MADEYRIFMAEAEKLDPAGFAKARLEAAELSRLSADNEVLRKLLKSTRAAMAESMRFYGQSGTNWTHMIKAIDDALAERPGECHHKWVNADNPYVQGADLCLECGDIRTRPGKA